MYKVLLADDERIIREGIAAIIEWEAVGTIFMGAVENGLEAYERIKLDPPDILITDIQMPGMDGLELTRRVHRNYPGIAVVILSGHGEFDFAREAMQFGVKHYLLKPCNEHEIAAVLEKIILEKQQEEKKEVFLQATKKSLGKVMPAVKEQFLKDLATGRSYSKNDLDFFREYLAISDAPVRIMLFQLEKSGDYEKRFALKHIAHEQIKAESMHYSTIIDENVLVAIPARDFQEMADLAKKIKDLFYGYYQIDLTVAISDRNSFWNIPLLYAEAQKCLKFRFYLGEGSIITKEDIGLNGNEKSQSLVFDYEKIAISVKSGNREEVKLGLERIFQELRASKCEINISKTYCIELFITIIRQCSEEKLGLYMNRIAEFEQAATLEQISALIKSVSYEIAQINYESTANKHNIVLNTVLICIRDNIANELLSLSWIAKRIIYMNEDYLGKLFKKEIGEKFSQYVLRVRMEKAKQLLESPHDYKAYEIAEMTGFGKNPQYFSQVFKKYTGVTPTEYKK